MFLRNLGSFGFINSLYSNLTLERKDLSFEESTELSALIRRSPEDNASPPWSAAESIDLLDNVFCRLSLLFWRDRKRLAMKFILPVVSVVSVMMLTSSF